MMTSGRKTLLDAVVTTGAGTETIEATRYRHFTFYIVASGTVSGTVAIQAKDASDTWQTISTNALSSAGTTVVQKEGAFYELRANVTARTNGTFSVHADFAS